MFTIYSSRFALRKKMGEVINPDLSTPEKQKTRSFLRQRFLKSLRLIYDFPCTFHMYANTTVTGLFRGTDIEFDDVLVENLKTPTSEIPHAKLRTSDIMYMNIDIKFDERKLWNPSGNKEENNVNPG